MKNKKHKCGFIAISLVLCSLLTACSAAGGAVDPGSWGYNCCVTYNALGGLINARDVRTTYYQQNSYLFEPSGSSNMLITPVRDGYVLVGWYTAKSPAAQGSVEDYFFSAADRWDFNTDRVQGNISLYARWITRGKVNYINAGTGDVIFSKNITAGSQIQKLSESVLNLKKPSGSSLAGYYEDKVCTKEYDFTKFTYAEPVPTEAELYAKLCDMFPQYLERVEYKEQKTDNKDSNAETPWQFLNKLGYALKTTDAGAIAEINAAKDQMVEDSIQAYLTNTANRSVYLKFNDGNYIHVHSANDLKVGSKTGFFDTDMSGQPITGYVLEADIDLKGVSLSTADKFTGKIVGNGHTISNLQITLASKKVDTDTEKFAGLAKVMDGAAISDLTIKDAKLTIQVNSGIRVSGGLLAASAKGVTLNNCHFSGLAISSGKGDDGQAEYKLGDLFGTYESCNFTNCSADGLTASVKSPDKLLLALFKLPK